jgi:hypothetical protein
MNRSNLDLETGVILIMVAMFEELGSGQLSQELYINSSSMQEREEVLPLNFGLVFGMSG